MDKNKKLTKELLKADSIDPSNIPDSERKMFEQLLDEHLNSGKSKQEIWRIIMKSNISKLAAAAVIIIAIFMGVNFLDGSINLTTIAFADIIEATKSISWMRMDSSGFERGITGVGEQWIGLDSKIHAGKWADGKVTFINLKENKSYKYDPEKYTVSITPFDEDDFPLNLSSPVELLNSMYQVLKEQGAQVTVSQSEYKGQKIQLQEYNLSVKIGQTNESQSLRLYIQTDSKLMLAAQVKSIDSEGNVTMDGGITFSYPQTGPSEIYDLGVPKDAKILDNTQREN